MLHNNSPLAIDFMNGNVYVSTLLSIRPTLSFLLCVHKSVFTPVFLFLSCKWILQYHFSRFHIYALVYNIWFFYLLHCVTGSVVVFDDGSYPCSPLSSVPWPSFVFLHLSFPSSVF